MRRLAALPLAIATLAASPASPDPRLPVLEEIGIDQRLGEEIPRSLSFRDEQGSEVRIGDYLGDKPVILVFAYYECPMLCTMVLNGLASSLGVLQFDAGEEFTVVTVSIDPEETPDLAAAKKRTYLDRYDRPGAERGWHFLTGEEESIRSLADAAGFRYVYDPDSDEFAHAAGLMVLTPEGRLSHYFYGVDFAARDLRLALVEASDGQIGSVVDQVLLYCYRYDPSTGRYSTVVVNVMRLGGLVTMIAIAAFLLVMWRREAARSRRRTA